MKNIASSATCSVCGGEVDGYICPGCRKSMASFDHDHWRNCPKGEKLKLKCKGCGLVETVCKC